MRRILAAAAVAVSLGVATVAVSDTPDPGEVTLQPGDRVTVIAATPTPTPDPTPEPDPDNPAEAVWDAPTGATVGVPVTFDGTLSTGDAPVACEWRFEHPDGTVIQTRPGCLLEFTFQGAGDKHVRLAVTDTDGDTADRARTFTVNPAEPTPTPTATPEPPAGTGIYPPGFPDATNTGVVNEAALVDRGSLVVTTAGQLVQNLNISGYLHIRANNVTVRNVRVTGGHAHSIRIYSGMTGIVIEDSEVDCNGAGTNDFAIGAEGQFHVRRVEIRECADGIVPNDGSIIEDNWVHDLQYNAPDPHYDGVQCDGGEDNVIIRHNTLDNHQDQTSAIICKADFGPINDILIENNFLNGGAFTFYSRAGQFNGNPNPAPTNVRLVDNWFGGQPGVFKLGTRWGATFGNCSLDGTVTRTGNRYWPSGTPIDKC